MNESTIANDTFGDVVLWSISSIFQIVPNSLQCFMDYYHYWYPTPFAADVIGATISSVTGYWIVGMLFTFVDFFHWPKFIFNYRIHDDQEEITLENLLRAVKSSLFNQLTIQLACTIIFHYLTMYVVPSDRGVRVPGLFTIIGHLAICQLIQEILFYYVHWLMHHNWFLYKYIHKVHHKYQKPFAVSAFDCHPLEHLFGNLLPVLIGPLLLGSHRGIIFLWLFMVHLTSLCNHCGYRIPGLPSSDFHDFHHSVYNENYGFIGLLDQIHGTNKRYKLLKNKQDLKQN